MALHLSLGVIPPRHPSSYTQELQSNMFVQRVLRPCSCGDWSQTSVLACISSVTPTYKLELCLSSMQPCPRLVLSRLWWRQLLWRHPATSALASYRHVIIGVTPPSLRPLTLYGFFSVGVIPLRLFASVSASYRRVCVGVISPSKPHHSAVVGATAGGARCSPPRHTW